MSITDYNRDFIPRMKDPKDLELEEICGMVEWLSKTPVGIDGILNMRLALQQMKALLETRQAIERFDRASSRLSIRILWLTGVLIIVGVVQVIVILVPLWKK